MQLFTLILATRLDPAIDRRITQIVWDACKFTKCSLKGEPGGGRRRDWTDCWTNSDGRRRRIQVTRLLLPSQHVKGHLGVTFFCQKEGQPYSGPTCNDSLDLIEEKCSRCANLTRASGSSIRINSLACFPVPRIPLSKIFLRAEINKTLVYPNSRSPG